MIGSKLFPHSFEFDFRYFSFATVTTVVILSLSSLFIDHIMRMLSTTSPQHWYMAPFHIQQMSGFRIKILKASIQTHQIEALTN
jgi:hypothetical protein